VLPSALSSYIARVRRYPKLKQAEVRRLAARVRVGGDRAAARALVTAHLGHVVRIARGMRHLYPNLLKLIQEGNLALVRAVHRYDPRRPVTLEAYVASWVRTYIARFILATADAGMGFVVEVGSENVRSLRAAASHSLHESLRHWEAEIRDHEGEGAHAGSDDGGGMPPDLEDPELTALALVIDGDDAAQPEALVAARQELRRLDAVLPEFERRLTPRERRIFKARVVAETPSTLSAQGAALGLSAERIRQIETQLTDRLRAALEGGPAATAQADSVRARSSRDAPTRPHRSPGRASKSGEERTRRRSAAGASGRSAATSRRA